MRRTSSLPHDPPHRLPTLGRPTLGPSTLGLVALLALAGFGFACSSDDAGPAAESSAAANSPATAEQSAPSSAVATPAVDTPGGLAPVTSRTSAGVPGGDAVATGDEIAAPGAVFRLPAAWQQEEPSSSMRLAQATIPGAGGEGQLTVFYFGPGGGGGVDANLQRWVGQMEVAAGRTPERHSFEVGAYRVTTIEVEGTLLPSTMGVGPTERQPDSTLLGAVVEGNEGPWFFKATGPTSTLDAEREAFLSMLRSARIP